jgi:hypothetical protein
MLPNRYNKWKKFQLTLQSKEQIVTLPPLPKYIPVHLHRQLPAYTTAGTCHQDHLARQVPIAPEPAAMGSNLQPLGGLFWARIFSHSMYMENLWFHHNLR